MCERKLYVDRLAEQIEAVHGGDVADQVAQLQAQARAIAYRLDRLSETLSGQRDEQDGR